MSPIRQFPFPVETSSSSGTKPVSDYISQVVTNLTKNKSDSVATTTIKTVIATEVAKNTFDSKVFSTTIQTSFAEYDKTPVIRNPKANDTSLGFLAASDVVDFEKLYQREGHPVDFFQLTKMLETFLNIAYTLLVLAIMVYLHRLTMAVYMEAYREVARSRFFGRESCSTRVFKVIERFLRHVYVPLWLSGPRLRVWICQEINGFRLDPFNIRTPPSRKKTSVQPALSDLNSEDDDDGASILILKKSATTRQSGQTGRGSPQEAGRNGF